MTFSSNSTQFSVDGNLNVSGPAAFNNVAVFANTITVQSQLIANGTSGTVGLLLLSGGSGNVYWGAVNSITSSFTNWQVNGAQIITASGSDTLNIIPGNNIVITASNSSIKSLTINANINLANTTTTGIVQLNDSISNTSITLAATANAVKNAYDRAIDANTRASSAQTAATNAYSNAILVSATSYSNAVSDASTDATTKAGTAYSNAIAYSGNAALAYANAIAYSGNAALAYANASIDATTKAGTAYSNAIAYSGNAALAYANAIAYAASNTYVNDTFALKSGPSFSGTSTFPDVNITGNLTVSGTTTYINTTTLNIGDNIITLNADLGAIAPTENVGFEVNRGSSANVALRWNETSDVWQITNDGTNYANIVSGSVSTPGLDSVLSAGSTSTRTIGIGNTTVTGFANVTSTIQGGSGLVIAGAASGITTLAAGNTTITGFANVSSTLQTSSLGVGTAASGTTGEIRATNEVTAYFSSDERLKENIIVIDDALGKLKQIRGVMYDWKDSHIQSRGGLDDYFVRKHDTGVIAQDVEKVLPEVVAERPDGTKAVRYEKLAGVIIQAINELADQVEEIKKRLD